MRISDWSSDVCSSDLQAAADSCHIAQYRLLGAADVADDRTGLQRAHATAECFGRMQHRHREHHQIGIAHGRRSIVEHLIDHTECGGLFALHGIWIEADNPFHLACRTQRPCERSTDRSEEHTSELQSLMRISYAVFCLKKKTTSFQANIT